MYCKYQHNFSMFIFFIVLKSLRHSRQKHQIFLQTDPCCEVSACTPPPSWSGDLRDQHWNRISSSGHTDDIYSTLKWCYKLVFIFIQSSGTHIQRDSQPRQKNIFTDISSNTTTGLSILLFWQIWMSVLHRSDKSGVVSLRHLPGTP